MGIETLNEDLELNIPMFDDDMDIIAKLDDEPNAVGGLSAAELKAEFDRPGKTIQKYLNETLVPSLIGTVAEESVRAQNEYVRVTNENQRIANEEAREKAEQAREDKTSGIVAQATEQAKKAEEQAKLAGQVKSMQAEAETLPAGSEATAKTEEENGRLVLKLGLPRGETGPRGKEGPPGPRGEPGNVDFEALTPEQMEMLKGDPGNPGPPGASPNISILPGERDEADGTVRYGTVIEVTNPDGSEVYAFVPDGRDGDQGKDGERGLAIYRANKPWSDWTSEYFDFSDFQLPNGYVPRVNDLVLTSNNYLCWIYSVDENTKEAVVASFMPAVSLNGGPGPAGEDGDTPYIGANGNWWIGGTDTGVAATGSGSGGASVQADWGENDETKLSHVKHRTHWKEEIGSDDVILDVEPAWTNTYALVDGLVNNGIKEGQTYIVIWDGEEHECVGKRLENGELYLGNRKLFETAEDTGEPFAVLAYTATKFYLYKANNSVIVAHVRVQGKKVVTYHRLDPEWLPVNEQKTITWDGVVKDGDVVIKQSNWMTHVKVSDQVLSEEDVVDGFVEICTTSTSDGEYTVYSQRVFSSSNIYPTAWGDGFEIRMGSILSGERYEPVTGEIVVVKTPTSEATALGVTPGIYFVNQVRIPEGFVASFQYGKENRISPNVMPTIYGGMKSRVEIIPETVIGENFPLMERPPLTVGKKYIVTWNGVEYIETAVPGYMNGMELGIFIGNSVSFTGENNGLPFFVAIIYPEYQEMLGVPGVMQTKNSTFGTNTISVSEVVYEPLNPVLHKLVVNFYTQDTTSPFTLRPDKTLEEIMVAVDAGFDVEARVSINITGFGNTIMVLPMVMYQNGDSYIQFRFAGITVGFAFLDYENGTGETRATLNISYGFD